MWCSASLTSIKSAQTEVHSFTLRSIIHGLVALSANMMNLKACRSSFTIVRNDYSPAEGVCQPVPLGHIE